MRKPLWTALAAALCVACEPDGSGVGTVAAWTVGSEPTVSIGVAQGEEPYLFSRIEAVRLLPDNRVVVVDGASQAIRIFDGRGTFERQLGREGEGPGEFSDLYYLSILPPDSIVGFDVELLRFTTFLASGELVASAPVDPTSGHPQIYFGSYASGDRGLGWIRPAERDQSVITADMMELARFDRGGQLRASIAVVPGLRRLGFGPTPVSPSLVSVLVGDTLFTTDGVGPIEVYGPGGEHLRSVAVPSEPLSAADAWVVLEQSLQGNGFLERLLPLRGVAGIDSIPSFADMLADDEGRLWLKRYHPGTDNPYARPRRTGGDWVIVERSGRLVASVTLPDRFRLMDVRGSRLAGVAYDELGIERVRIHEVRP
jgi:hypothetical protein